MKKIVVAIGGNALGNTPEEQKEIVKNTSTNLVNLVKEGYELVIVHGNGPQVGMINMAFDIVNQNDSKSPVVDFPECGSMSQGYIGFHLQNAIMNELQKNNIKKSVVSLITQTVVEKDDEGFKNPTKPIGSFYTKEASEELVKKYGWSVKEDAGRGYRRVIASPKPVDIIEKDIIKETLNNGSITIAGGGGGIPVIKSSKGYEGIAAVIDKDFAAALIAKIVDADKLLILTAVEKVMINFGKSDQQSLNEINLKKAQEYIDDNQFAPGSMLPKIQAAMKFIELGGKETIIGSLEKASDVIKGKSGTKIIK